MNGVLHITFLCMMSWSGTRSCQSNCEKSLFYCSMMPNIIERSMKLVVVVQSVILFYAGGVESKYGSRELAGIYLAMMMKGPETENNLHAKGYYTSCKAEV
jgi:hypothetical protein